MRDFLEWKLRKFYGLPPFNTGPNPCFSNGLHANSILEEYSLDVINAANRRLGKPEWKRRRKDK